MKISQDLTYIFDLSDISLKTLNNICKWKKNIKGDQLCFIMSTKVIIAKKINIKNFL